MKSSGAHKIKTIGSRPQQRCLPVPISGSTSHAPGCDVRLGEPNTQKQKQLILCEAAVRRERNPIAVDIHDTLAQDLNAIILQMEAAEYDFFREPREARRKLRRALNLTSEAIAATRRLMWTLCHEPIAGGDLAGELSVFARQVFAGTPVKLELSLAKGSCPLPSRTRAQLLRIGKEALSNAVKHAQPSRVCIELAYLPRQVRLQVQDNGKGFRPGPIPVGRHGFGLCGMRARATGVGGTVTVNSQPGAGTRVLALMPIPAGSTVPAAA